MQKFQDYFGRNFYVDDNLSSAEDEDVKNERKRINYDVENNRIQDVLSIYHLRKTYSHVVAVNDLTFGIHNRECFGMLGVNGAGKTTTFGMLVGDIASSDGDAFLFDETETISLHKNLKWFQSKLGYCPQFDALLTLITGEETLYFFARILGIPQENMKRDIDNLIGMVGLEKEAHQIAESYSGGTKRKLSIAIALLGNPKVLLLDEPTTGIDPISRRKIWKTLNYIKKNLDCSILLSSHSMDECEELCSRLAIMVSGRFRCLGSTQELKAKYGQGFTVIITLKNFKGNDVDSYVIKLQTEMQKLLSSAVMRDKHESFLYFRIADPKEKWSNIFRQMITLNEMFDFEDYYVSETTLEQIFLTLARA